MVRSLHKERGEHLASFSTAIGEDGRLCTVVRDSAGYFFSIPYESGDESAPNVNLTREEEYTILLEQQTYSIAGLKPYSPR